jgi:hypothetical protein
MSSIADRVLHILPFSNNCLQAAMKVLFYILVLYLSTIYTIYVKNYLFLIDLLHVSMFT